tara:strand:- start:17 stop:139 length:123 start_codon:yes stop_codon:yes gene_type:complete
VTSKDTEKMRLEKRIQWLLEVNNKRGVQLLKEKYRRKYGK